MKSNGKFRYTHSWATEDKRKRLLSTALWCIPLIAFVSCSEKEPIKEPIQEYRGVVTLQLLPAKVMKINRIIENPEPGTSPIGEEGLLVEVDQNPEVMANWTVVNVKYRKYDKPKVIKYEILGEPKEVAVQYQAVSIAIDGDMSQYVQQQ